MPSCCGAGIDAVLRGPGCAFTTDPTGPLSGVGGFCDAGAGVNGEVVCAARICDAAKRTPHAATRVPRTQGEIFISTTPLSPPTTHGGRKCFGPRGSYQGISPGKKQAVKRPDGSLSRGGRSYAQRPRAIGHLSR